ncbi:MAG: hypothetical protein MK161_08110 [Pirellulales bacterium]|nr:hypothetical protein [Pirellulales bacterium]
MRCPYSVRRRPRLFVLERMLRFERLFWVGLLGMVGCHAEVSRQMVGTWQGRPAGALSGDDLEPTDLQKLDFQLTLDLRGDQSVEMWRGDQQDRLSGTWKILNANGRQLRLQLVAEHPEDPLMPQEVRNFAVALSADGHQFTLVEEGADPRFGSLLFVRGPS